MEKGFFRISFLKFERANKAYAPPQIECDKSGVKFVLRKDRDYQKGLLKYRRAQAGLGEKLRDRKGEVQEFLRVNLRVALNNQNFRELSETFLQCNENIFQSYASGLIHELEVGLQLLQRFLLSEEGHH